MRKCMTLAAIALPLILSATPAAAINRCAVAMAQLDQAQNDYERWWRTEGSKSPQGQLCNDGGEGARITNRYFAAQAAVRRWC